MTDANSFSSRTTSPSAAAKIGWTILIGATLYVCYFSHLGAIGFVGPDEPRYAWIARDMAETGDWVTPRLYGRPWFEKPPLFYWGAAISFKLFGVSEAAARLPSAICALLATLALAWLAWRMYGAETAQWLLLLLPTTVGMIGFSHAAATDMPFSGMLTIAMVCAAVALRLTPERASASAFRPADAHTAGTPSTPSPLASAAARSKTPWFALVLFGFFLGLAVLAKGPAANILCGGAVFFWAVFTKRWRDAFRLLHPAAIVAFCVTALPWYILCARRNPDFFRIFIIEHNFKRYLTPEFQHIQPFWYYVPVVLIAVLPWTALLIWSAVVGTLRIVRERQITVHSAYFASWALFCVVFFSASKSKLPGYILPAIPALCMAMVRDAMQSAPIRLRSLRTAHWIMAAILTFCFAIFGFFSWMSSRHDRNAQIALSIVVGLFALANCFVATFTSNLRGVSQRLLAGVCCIAPILLAALLAGTELPEAFFWDQSGKRISQVLKTRAIPNEELYVQQLHRGLQYSLDFYLRAELRDWDATHPVAGYVLTHEKSCKNSVPAAWTCDAIVLEGMSSEYALYRVRPNQSVSSRTRSGQPQ